MSDYVQVPAEGRHPGWPARPGRLHARGGVVELRPVRWRDGRQWRRLRIRDQAYLRPWEPDSYGTWEERHTRSAWAAQVSGLRAMARRGQALPFVIIVNDQLAGQVTLGNVVRGSLRSCWVGYWVESQLAGKGIATAAVALAVDHAFGQVRLHRVEATVRPENEASLRVLDKLGFREEGLLRRYLEVDGRWRDHHCLAITREEIGRGGLIARLIAEGRVRRA